MSLYSRLDRIAADVEKLNRQVNSVANSPQSQRTSVEGGSIDFNDADGNLKAIVGEQTDGGNTVNVLTGPTPPTPTNFTVTVDHGSLTVHWDGEFEDGAVAPSDWARWTAYAQEGQFVVPDRTTSIGGTDSASGGEVTAGVLKGEWTVTLLAWSQAGKPSAMATPVTVEVPGYGEIVLEEIDAAETRINNAREILVAEQGTLGEKLDATDGTLTDLGQDIAAVEDAQDQLDTDLTDVMTSVDGKNTITWNPSAPSKVSTPGKAVGDLWYRTSGNSIVGFWKWDGSDWVTQLLDKTTIPLIDIGAGTFGSLAGSRIEVGSIYADRIVSGLSQNMVPDPGFLNEELNASRLSRAESWGSTWSITNGIARCDTTAGLTNNPVFALAATSDREAWSAYPGMTMVHRFRARVTGGTGYARGTAFLLRRDGTRAYVAMNPSSWQTLNGEWRELAFTYELGDDVASYTTAIQVRSTSTGVLEFSAPFSASTVGATVIEDGAVSTQKLSADVLEVKNLKATTGQLDEAVINKLFSDVVVAKMAVAQEFIGENAILTGAVTAPKITASEELWAKIGQFVKIRAEHIEADAIDGMVITGPNIRTAASGARVQMDPNGVRVFNADNDVRTHLSPDGSTFKGEFEAETLVVNEGAEFKANNTLAQGSSLTLAAGVTDPTAPPAVQPFWGGAEFTPPALLNGQLVGLAFDGTNYWTTTGTWYEQANPNNQVFRINSTTGTVTGFAFPESGTSERFGVTCIGSELFWYYRTGYTHKVVVTNLSVVKLREFTIPAADVGHSASNPLTFKPGIGNDGTNVVVGHCSDDGTLRVRTYNKTTGVQVGSTASEGNSNFASDITGIHVGAADGSTTRIWVNQERTGIVYAYTTAGVYVSGEQFPVAEANSTGLVFSGGKFHTLDPTGVVHEYADKDTGDGSGDWWVAYRWYTDVDNDDLIEPTDYTSRVSPGARFTWPKRAMIRVQGQPLPAGVGAVGPFLAKKSTVPIRTDYHAATWWAITGTSRAEYRSLPTNWATKPVPTDSNNFPNAEKAVIESASATFRVEGDGSGRWGPLTFNADGTMSGIPKMAVGKGETVTVTSGGFNTKTVTFPQGRFTTPPTVVVSADTTSEALINVGALSVTKDGFTLSVRRTNSTPTGVDWIAMEVN